MSFISTLSIDYHNFGDGAITEETVAFNEKMQAMLNTGPNWFEVGAERYRRMREAGQTPLPKIVYLEQAENFNIPSRDPGRSIPCRILRPRNGRPARAVYLHLHGGGWVLLGHDTQDVYLQDIADMAGVVVVSVGYRLAPEHPYPAGPEDCYDAAEWLIEHAESRFGASWAFLGGESAGAHMSMLVTFYLLQHQNQCYANFRLKGLVLNFGCFSMNYTPSVYNFDPSPALGLNRVQIDRYVEAFLPRISEEEKRSPSVSPLYADLESLRGRLPPALFTCGTYDCLLDDTIFMSAKWSMAGAETVVKIVPGALHGYIVFPRVPRGSGAAEGLDAVEKFIAAQMS